MMNEESLKTWEQENIELLTSREMGEWLYRRDMNARPQGDLIKAFELLKAYCKNRECNKNCIFFREVHIGNNKDTYCALCEIVMSDD